MLFIIFKVQMISTQQVVQFHCLQIIRIYKQTINRSHGFHGRSPIFFLQCVILKAIQCEPVQLQDTWLDRMKLA